MKKLILNLDGKKILSKDQMKKITGGYGSCGGMIPVQALAHIGSCGITSGHLCYYGDVTIVTHVTQAQALCFTNGISGAHWCCDSCGSSSWYGSC